MKRIATLISLLIFPVISWSQITILNPAGDGGFETGGTFAANGWTSVNPASNLWQVGTAILNAGTRGAYISNDGGVTNGYATGTTRVSHFYRDVVFPAGNQYITLSFNWTGQGEPVNADYMRVSLTSTTFTPVANALPAAAAQLGGPYNGTGAWQTATLALPCSYAGTTQRLIFTWRNDGAAGTQPPAAIDNISIVVNNVGPSCTAMMGLGVTSVASLPYASGAGTTCGFVNDMNALNLGGCGNTNYFSGQDVAWEFTPAASGQITCAATSVGTNVGLTLYSGCPIGCGAAPVCIAFSQSASGTQAFCANVVAGTTYYLILDSWANPTCNAYSNITISAPNASPPGYTCATAITAALPYVATAQSTVCSVNDYTNLSTGSCGTLYESGEDMVYAVTVTGSTCIGVSLTNCSSANIGYQVYSGCPGNAGTVCIGNNGGSRPCIGSVTLPAAGTYYVIVDSWSAPSYVNYDISIVEYGTGPVNDLPCNATALALNTNISGDNMCAGAASEPAAATCFSAGNLNTVWYTVVCPASGQLRIRTTLGSNINTQMALYSGTCGALVQVACNNDAPACGTFTYRNSEITAAGLTPGATYFICVDGLNNITGTFDIIAVDGTVGFPALAGQDCGSPNPVCAASLAIGNPGYQAYGNICDFTNGLNCLAAGERGSVWYTIPINANGNLDFDIVPNDWGGAPSTASTDYDFAIWQTTGTSATTCAGIAGGAAPTRCNYSGLGVTGCAAGGNAPAAYPGYNASYEATIPVLAGEVYQLVISNFSNSTSGYTVNFSAGSPINYTAAGSSVTWTGGNNTSWTLAANWGACTPPICGISAVVGPSSTNQPILTAGNYYVNDLTINPGGVLTLQAGANLHICGNFTNSGSIVASATSTITFDNAAATHTMTGAFVGVDAIGNLVINQTGGSVILASNIDIKGNLTTSNGTSVLNMNGRYVRLAGNFSNFNGGTTVTNTAGSTLEFNGTAAQTYNQGASTLSLNNVLMLHTSTGVTLQTHMVLGAAGTLTLTSGRIITTAPFEVQVNNTASAACNAGNATSFVQGNLRRYLDGAATSYNFPVGHATPGYQLANITFTTATTIPQLLARFDTYAPPMGPAANECPNNTYNTLPLFNNGYWTITASANPTNGTYDATLYPTTVTNNTGLGWTVVKGATTATFGLDGTCAASTAAQVIRTGMNGFSVFAIAQSASPLPVEFISFTGVAMAEYNQLNWSTASETNNQYYYVERSDDGINFHDIGRKNGAGTTSQMRNYSFEDFSPLEGTNYYRLRQVDYNGAFMYTAIITVEFHRGHMTVTNVMPNPTNGELNFDFNSPTETLIHMVITDMTGRTIRDEYVAVKPGTTTVNTVITEGSGVYSLLITEEKTGFRSVTRVVRY